MATYVVLMNLTDEGRKTLKQRAERLKDVNKEVEETRVKIVAQYAVLGQYDYVDILEAPNNEVMSRMLAELASKGTVRTMTLPAMTIDDFIKSLKK